MIFSASKMVVQPCFPGRPIFLCALGIAVVALSGCGKPFNVKTKTDLPPARYAASTSSNGLNIQAQAITDEDFLYNTFDANLISAGVLPVRVMLKNSSGATVDLRKARFEIRQPSGRSFKAVETRAAYKRLIAYYEISAYNKSGYKESLGDFSEYGVDLRTPLEAGQSRQGFLFFLVPGEAARGTGLIMVVSKIGPESKNPVELTLN